MRNYPFFIALVVFGLLLNETLWAKKIAWINYSRTPSLSLVVCDLSTDSYRESAPFDSTQIPRGPTQQGEHGFWLTFKEKEDNRFDHNGVTYYGKTWDFYDFSLNQLLTVENMIGSVQQKDDAIIYGVIGGRVYGPVAMITKVFSYHLDKDNYVEVILPEPYVVKARREPYIDIDYANARVVFDSDDVDAPYQFPLNNLSDSTLTVAPYGASRFTSTGDYATDLNLSNLKIYDRSGNVLHTTTQFMHFDDGPLKIRWIGRDLLMLSTGDGEAFHIMNMDGFLVTKPSHSGISLFDEPNDRYIRIQSDFDAPYGVDLKFYPLDNFRP